MPRTASSNIRTPRFILLASICVIVAALYFAQDVLVPLALAMLLSFLLAPLVKWLERAHLPRPVGVIAVMTATLALFVALGFVVYTQLAELAQDLPRYEQNIRAKIAAVAPSRGGMLEKMQKAAENISRAAEEPTTQATQPTTAAAGAATDLARGAVVEAVRGEPPPEGRTSSATPLPPGTEANPIWVVPRDPPATSIRVLQEYLARAAPPMATAGIVLVFAVFMLLAREDMRDRLIRLVGHSQLHITTQALDDAAKRISRYLLMQVIINGTYAIAIGTGLWIIGVPSPVLWALLCFVLRFIPYVGPWIAAAFPLMLSLASFVGFKQFVYTGLLFVVIELLSNNVMEPLLYGSSTGMSTVAVLVSAVFWTWLWGPIGLAIATPMTVCLVVLGKYVPQLQFLDILLGDEPVLAPHERVYQRLLALDQEEATEFVESLLVKQPLEDVYDDVLMPALALAEQDRHSDRIDDERAQAVASALREIVDEFGDREKMAEVRRAADRTLAEARGEVETAPASAAGNDAADGGKDDRPARARLPKECIVNVVCLPAHDDADEIVGIMFAQLLELRGYCAVAVSRNALASEMIERVHKERADIVCVSALPPAAVSHARYLCKRLQDRAPEIDMVVGLWSVKTNLERARERIVCSGNVELVTTLKQALERVRQFAEPLLARASADAPRA